MTKKQYCVRYFTLEDTNTNKLSIKCWTEDTRYGFRHLAELRQTQEGEETRTNAKCTYYNRTWESYQYQSVLFNVIGKHFGKDTKNSDKYKAMADLQGLGCDTSIYKSVAMVNAIGSLITDNQEDKNKWDKRMITAGLPNVQFPDNWDELPEDVKTKRLAEINKLMQEVSK